MSNILLRHGSGSGVSKRTESNKFSDSKDSGSFESVKPSPQRQSKLKIMDLLR